LWLLLGYLAMPIDLVPDFIPVIGYADDAVVVAVALRSVTRRAGEEALERHWPGTPEGLAAIRRLAGIADDGDPGSVSRRNGTLDPSGNTGRSRRLGRMTAQLGTEASSPNDPWFRKRPTLVVLLAVAMFAAVLVVRMSTGTEADAYSMLYALPVALLAVTFGLRPGLLAGVVAVGLIAVWTLTEDVSLTMTGWTSRVVPLLLLGLLLGDASDRATRAESERRRLESAALLHKQAIEINDSLIQGMAAAKWSFEAGNVDAGLKTLDTTLGQAQELVSGLIRQAGMGDRTEHIQR
jgi:hypothetical protein